jgi:flagellar biosynthetic protein FliQ
MMSESLIIDIMREALMTVLMVAGPILLTAMAVGLLVSILQATTQIQEQTMSFVPKLVAIFVAIVVLSSFMISQMTNFMNMIFELISTIG